MSSIHPVIFIVGPTAVGKSAFALDLAEEFGGSILNCDSVQTYAHVQIGAAKPLPQELERVPHHLVGYVTPPQELTAAQFRRDALQILEQETKKGPVFAVGGSGFYIQALKKGLYSVGQVDPIRRDYWKSRLEFDGAEVLYRELKSIDPGYALKISQNDGYRIVRALELIESENKSMEQIQMEFDQRAKADWPYKTYNIALSMDRNLLRKRIAERTQAMLQQGLIEEVHELLQMNLKDWAPLRSVGYLEVVQGLESGSTPMQMAEKIEIHTAQLAKKQMTWFRRDTSLVWSDVSQDLSRARRLLLEILDRGDS